MIKLTKNSAVIYLRYVIFFFTVYLYAIFKEICISFTKINLTLQMFILYVNKFTKKLQTLNLDVLGCKI